MACLGIDELFIERLEDVFTDVSQVVAG